MDSSITVEKNGIMITVYKKKGEMNEELHRRAWYMIDLIPKYNYDYNKALVLANQHIFREKGCVYN